MGRSDRLERLKVSKNKLPEAQLHEHDDNERTQRFALRLTKRELAALQSRAKSEGSNVSVVIRRAVRKELGLK